MGKSFKSKYVDFEVRLQTKDIIKELEHYVSARVSEEVQGLRTKWDQEITRLAKTSIDSESKMLGHITDLQRAIIQLKSELDSVKMQVSVK